MSVSKISDAAGASSKHWTPEEMLEDSLEQVRAGKIPGKKAVVIFLDDTEGEEHYATHWLLSGMQYSEMVALLSVVQHLVLADMRDGGGGL